MSRCTLHCPCAAATFGPAAARNPTPGPTWPGPAQSTLGRTNRTCVDGLYCSKCRWPPQPVGTARDGQTQTGPSSGPVCSGACPGGTVWRGHRSVSFGTRLFCVGQKLRRESGWGRRAMCGGQCCRAQQLCWCCRPSGGRSLVTCGRGHRCGGSRHCGRPWHRIECMSVAVFPIEGLAVGTMASRRMVVISVVKPAVIKVSTVVPLFFLEIASRQDGHNRDTRPCWVF